ncbi:sepiapterin reductase [Pararge aegeria]|uniref:Sepiapterin reductase n=4 Tax=Pararge aegeria TaxID=116150 RepID=A0A8S4S1X8_9NEOP|nr:sepiapterin reductase [Pararge aegeria]CAH2246195.1 jg3682 [Pararge aegeria aegeria]
MASSSSVADMTGPSFCVVTGASQGIGRAISIEIAKCFYPGSLMLLLARNYQELSITADSCESGNVKVIHKSVDLSTASEEDMMDILKNALAGYQINNFKRALIFHNVGSLGNLAIETSRMENVPEMRKYYDLNVFKVISLNTQFLKLFEDVVEQVVIVNITSLCAIKPMGGMAYYCSAKAAREMYFRVLAEEKKNIKVLNYSPGPVETAMIENVLEEAINKNLREVFTSFKNQGTLLKPEVTARKCVAVLLAAKFSPGEHVDYFDDE